MLKTVTLTAALLAAVFSALLGIPTAAILGRVRALRTAPAALPPLPDVPAAPRAAPLLGGLLLWPAVGAAFVAGWLLVQTTLAAGGYANGWYTVGAMLGVTMGFGLIGLADDCLRVARQGRGMAIGIRLVLQLVVTGLFFGQLAVGGTLSTLVWLPGAGWVQLGLWYYAVGTVLILAVVNAMHTTRDAAGLGSGVAFVSALTLLVLAMLLLELDIPGDRFVTGLFAAAVAGGCVGFLFWDFPPSRLRLGGAGAMFLGGALVAMAWGLGRPMLLLPVCLPALCNGLTALIAALCRRGGALHQLLARRGWQQAAVTALFCGLGCLGSLTAVLLVFGK